MNQKAHVRLDDLAANAVAEVDRLQASFGSVFAVSVTSRCNLRCTHCGRDCTLRGDDLADELTDAICTEVATQPSRVKEIGITGGEPTLNPRAVRKLAEVAASHQVAACLMTNGHWATSPATAKRMLRRFPGLHAIVVSTDLFHLPFIPVDVVRNAYEAACHLGLEARILVTLSPRRLRGERALLDTLSTIVQDAGDLMTQALKPIGRGRILRVGFQYSSEVPPIPCTTQGPLIREDGLMLPCCHGIEWIPQDHPMCVGDLRRTRLWDLFRLLDEHPIVHFLRTWGMPELLDRLREAGVARHLPQTYLDFDTCHCCAALCASPEVTGALRSLKQDSWFQVQVAAGRHHLLNEPSMMQLISAKKGSR